MISGLRPSYLYGRRHDYVYYPESWVDQSTGTSYAKGYYDENGQYYDSVAFQKDGKYENVVCSCPYCGQNTVLNLTAEDAAARNLQCPHCGGPMEIQSELDDYVRQGIDQTQISDPEDAYRQARKKKRRRRHEPRKDDVVLDEGFKVLMDLIRMTGGAEVPEQKGWWL